MLWGDISSVAQGGCPGKGSAAVLWLLGKSRAPHESCIRCGSMTHWIVQVWNLTDFARGSSAWDASGAVFVGWDAQSIRMWE